jgi:hypothetical protein
LLAYIGWLADEKDAGRRSVAPTSLTHYLSAIRVMHQSITGQSLGDMPMVAVASRAYGHWYEEDAPRMLRLGVPAHTVLSVWRDGMQTSSDAVLQSATTIVLTFVLGLRESSVLSIAASNVDLTADAITVRLTMSKGRLARDVPPAVYRRISANLPSALDLFALWQRRRGRHPIWLALDADPTSLPPGTVTRMLRSHLASLALSAVGYSSHSLRIGAHTEQVLLNIPLEVRKARFGWGPNSPMEAVYFDRSIRMSAASSWFFGHHATDC